MVVVVCAAGAQCIMGRYQSWSRVLDWCRDANCDRTRITSAASSQLPARTIQPDDSSYLDRDLSM